MLMATKYKVHASNMQCTGDVVRAEIRWRYKQTKGCLAMILMLVASNIAAQPEGLRLVLAPAEEVAIKPRATVALDAYLYNPGPAAVHAPPLASLSATYTLNDVTGVRSTRAGASGEISTAPVKNDLLQPGSLERRRINIEIPAESGDLVRVHVELGKNRALRSNSVLMFCPAKGIKVR